MNKEMLLFSDLLLRKNISLRRFPQHFPGKTYEMLGFFNLTPWTLGLGLSLCGSFKIFSFHWGQPRVQSCESPVYKVHLLSTFDPLQLVQRLDMWEGNTLWLKCIMQYIVNCMSVQSAPVSKNKLTLTTNRAKRMTPQLQTSAFLPSYFSP